MEDQFEEFVKKHRDALDVYEPRTQLWDSVQEQLKRQKKQRWLKYAAIAAGVLLIAGTAAWILEKKTQPVMVQQTAEQPISPEIQEAEKYYSSIVEVKRAELNKYCKDYPELGKEFEQEVNNLNVLYSQLKEEYKNSDGREAVMKAMIDNLQTQVQITGRQLQIIQSVKQKEAKNRI